MKVAICFEKGRVFQHFGHTKEFKIYEIKDNKVTDFYYVNASGEGCSALVPILKFNQVNVLICGGLGDGAYNHLTEQGIIVLSEVDGDVDEVIGEFINETLEYKEGANCDHHENEGEDHHCHDNKKKCH